MTLKLNLSLLFTVAILNLDVAQAVKEQVDDFPNSIRPHLRPSEKALDLEKVMVERNPHDQLTVLYDPYNGREVFINYHFCQPTRPVPPLEEMVSFWWHLMKKGEKNPPPSLEELIPLWKANKEAPVRRSAIQNIAGQIYFDNSKIQEGNQRILSCLRKYDLPFLQKLDEALKDYFPETMNYDYRYQNLCALLTLEKRYGLDVLPQAVKLAKHLVRPDCTPDSRTTFLCNVALIMVTHDSQDKAKALAAATTYIEEVNQLSSPTMDEVTRKWVALNWLSKWFSLEDESRENLFDTLVSRKAKKEKESLLKELHKGLSQEGLDIIRLHFELLKEPSLEAPLLFLIQGARLINKHDGHSIPDGIGQFSTLANEFFPFRIILEGPFC